MPPLHQENQGVELFAAEENRVILSIAFVGADTWTAEETEQNQHELQIINIKITRSREKKKRKEKVSAIDRSIPCEEDIYIL